MTLALIELSDLGFSWPGHPPLLDIPAFRLEPGETLFLKGPSGSGKTTLLGLLGGVQKPNRGSIRLLGQELTELSAGARASKGEIRYRNPQNPSIGWSGKGRKPLWIVEGLAAGKSLQDFAV